MTKKTIVLLCALLMCAVPLLASAAADNDADRIDTSVSYKSFTPFPILMYDTDIGIGYGGKAKMIDFLGKRESFDLILFNSSKGERWYVFTFSIPDFEIRQSKVYSLSLDVKAEYDKYLKYYYYGLGPDSSEESETSFSSEKMELELTLGRGITTQFVIEGGYVLRNIRYFDIEGGQPFSNNRYRGGPILPLRLPAREIRHLKQPDPSHAGIPYYASGRHRRRIPWQLKRPL